MNWNPKPENKNPERAKGFTPNQNSSAPTQKSHIRSRILRIETLNPQSDPNYSRNSRNRKGIRRESSKELTAARSVERQRLIVDLDHRPYPRATLPVSVEAPPRESLTRHALMECAHRWGPSRRRRHGRLLRFPPPKNNRERGRWRRVVWARKRDTIKVSQFFWVLYSSIVTRVIQIIRLDRTTARKAGAQVWPVGRIHGLGLGYGSGTRCLQIGHQADISGSEGRFSHFLFFQRIENSSFIFPVV